jgi:hypothetical protein
LWLAILAWSILIIAFHRYGQKAAFAAPLAERVAEMTECLPGEKRGLNSRLVVNALCF